MEKREGRGLDAKALIAQINQGMASIYEGAAWRDYLAFSSNFWGYSFRNQILIAMQKPGASRVAGFNTWKALGRYVKKGEKGIAILRPYLIGGKKSEGAGMVDGEGRTEAPSVSGKTLSGFGTCFVFDISQTEGAEVPEIAHKLKGAAPEGLYYDLLGLAAKMGVSVEKESMAADLGGFLRKGAQGPEIRLNAANDEAQQVKTFIHELAHFLAGHQEERRKELTREARELEAESAAYIVGAALGIDFSEYSFGYLASWAQDMAAEVRQKAIQAAGDMAAKVAKQILSGIGAEEKAEALAA